MDEDRLRCHSDGELTWITLVQRWVRVDWGAIQMVISPGSLSSQVGKGRLRCHPNGDLTWITLVHRWVKVDWGTIQMVISPGSLVFTCKWKLTKLSLTYFDVLIGWKLAPRIKAGQDERLSIANVVDYLHTISKYQWIAIGVIHVWVEPVVTYNQPASVNSCRCHPCLGWASGLSTTGEV